MDKQIHTVSMQYGYARIYFFFSMHGLQVNVAKTILLRWKNDNKNNYSTPYLSKYILILVYIYIYINIYNHI